MINEFEFDVFTKDLEYIGVLDSFISVRWRRQYFGYGEMEIHLNLDDQVKRYLNKDTLFVRKDAKEVGILESYQLKDDGAKTEVVIYGKFLSSILSRRIVKERINFNGSMLDGERALLNKMTPFSNLELKETNIPSDKIVFQCTYQNVGDYLIRLAKASGVAHRVVLDMDKKKFVYENYKGLDRTETQKDNVRFEFSEDKSNIETAESTYDFKTECNYVLVGGSGEGEERILVEVKDKDYSDFDLREVFVDAKDLSMDETIQLDEYKEMLKTRGKENLISQSESIEITVFTDEYKKGWDLGDIVNVKKESWNFSLKLRIIEIEEVIEDKKRCVYATFGSPLNENFVDEEE